MANPKDKIGRSKSLLHLVPPVLYVWLAEVFRQSAPEYGPFNWRENTVSRTVYLDAAMRHLLALMDGQRLDLKTGLPHEAHIAANMAILLDSTECGTQEDDMPYACGPSPHLMDSFTNQHNLEGRDE